jgi:hypothetical protein
MRDNLDTFAECVRNAPTVPKAEEFVRLMMGKFAKSCPMWVPKTSSAGRIRRQKRSSALGASCRQTRVADRFPYGW